MSFNNDQMRIERDIVQIVKYFEDEEQLYHKNIGIICDFNDELKKDELMRLSVIKLRREVAYEFFIDNQTKSCMNSEHDLMIKIPKEALCLQKGKYKYSFQSRLKNVYGTYEIDVNAKRNGQINEEGQIITVSIGH